MLGILTGVRSATLQDFAKRKAVSVGGAALPLGGCLTKPIPTLFESDAHASQPLFPARPQGIPS